MLYRFIKDERGDMKQRERRWVWVIGTLSCITWAVMFSGCGSSGGLVEVGGGITLSADPAIIAADGKSSSTIVATITSTGGTAVPIGTEVSFSTNLGRFSNGSNMFTTTTGNSAGTITVSLISGTVEGTATVRCSAGGASQTIEIYIGNVAISTVTLNASPTSIAASSVQSSLITASVKDSFGKSAKAGTAVTFRTTLGFFSNKSSVFGTQTDSNGIASATLFAGETTGIAEIVCTAGRISSVVYVEIAMNPNPTPGGVANIAVSASPLSIQADGISSSVITAILTDSNGTAVTMGTPVSFATDLGTFSNASKGFSTTTAGTDGSAKATLFSGTTPGTAKITVSSGSVTSMVYVEFRSF